MKYLNIDIQDGKPDYIAGCKWHKNCLKDQFQQKPGSFFYFIVPQFHLKLTIKMASFVTNFWQKSWNFWAVSWNRDIGIKCWNCQFGRKKFQIGGTRLRRGRQFQFFPVKLTVSTFYINITVSWNCPKISTFSQKLVTKLVIFICKFHVKLCDNKIKKWTRFFLETGLLANFYAKRTPLERGEMMILI